MYLHDETDWNRMTAAPLSWKEMHRIGGWLDKGTNEDLYFDPRYGKLYRRRHWNSRVAGKGEIWFLYYASQS